MTDMKWPALFLAYTLCTSCAFSAEDPFVKAGGLDGLQSREHLLERDIRLALATAGTSFDNLAEPVRICLATRAIALADPALLQAADGFLARKSEDTWLAYRETQQASDVFSTARMLAMTNGCRTQVLHRA